MMDTRPSYFRRYWILLVLRAAKFAGAGTVSSDFFHRLIYYVNALLPSVGLPAETAKVLKASYGPFFPDYQWDLDRLVGNSLVEVADLTWISDDQRFFGKYRITKTGLELVERLSGASVGLSDIEGAISEMVSAFLSTPGALSAIAAKIDANLGQDTIREGEVVDFGEWKSENHSQDAAVFLFRTWLEEIVSRANQAANSELGNPASSGNEVPEAGVVPSHSIGFNWAPDAQHSKSFHLYAHYLVHKLAARDNSALAGA